jgi:hypothetical protein
MKNNGGFVHSIFECISEAQKAWRNDTLSLVFGTVPDMLCTQGTGLVVASQPIQFL